MNKQELLNKYKKEEDRLLVAKIIDKYTFSKTKNKITTTDFLDMHQFKISKEVVKESGDENYIYYGGFEDSDRKILIFYPDKIKDLFDKNFDFSEIVKVIKIELPNEDKCKYSHRIYLSGIMKLGIKREKIGDILVLDDGAYIIVEKDLSEYLCDSLKQLKRFNKCKINITDVKNIKIPERRTELIRIIVPSMRLDSIVSEISHTSRTLAENIIEEQRVFVNYEDELRKSRQINENDIIVIRGKGKFIIREILGTNKKGKINVLVEHYI